MLSLSANDVPDLQFLVEPNVLREAFCGHADASGDYEHGRRFGPDSFDDPSGQPVVEEGRVEHCALCGRRHVVAREDGVVAEAFIPDFVECRHDRAFRHIGAGYESPFGEELHGVVEAPDLPADAQTMHAGVDHVVRNSRHAFVHGVDVDHRLEPGHGVLAVGRFCLDHFLDTADGGDIAEEDCVRGKFHDEVSR